MNEDEKRQRLRDWLDRPPPLPTGRIGDLLGLKPWRSWFDADGNYLGNRSVPAASGRRKKKLRRRTVLE